MNKPKYNGLKSSLMNELTEGLNKHRDVNTIEDWYIISLYLSRVCNSLQKSGWKKSIESVNPYGEGDI